MPELPDLHLFAHNLRKRILRRPIRSVEVINRRCISVTPSTLELALLDSEFDAIHREGKELHFALRNTQTLAVHLMLCGRFHLLSEADLIHTPSKLLTIGLEGGEYFVITDFQGKAKITLNPLPSDVPDALSEAFTLDYLTKLLKRKRTLNLKELLLDQKSIKGIGNAYADEILYKANLSPLCTAGGLPPEAIAELHAATLWVLQDAIAQLQRLTPEAIHGEERSFLRVHRPREKFAEDGELILKKEIARRGTYYTAKQRMFL